MNKKKISLYWIIAVLPMIVTIAFMPFMEDKIPIHYNASGRIDKWGSKYTYLIISMALLSVSALLFAMCLYFSKKKCDSDKEKASLSSNSKVLYIVGILISAFETIMMGTILFSAYQAVKNDSTKMEIDINKVLVITLGVLLIVLGNYIPKTRKNSIIGVRTPFSMKNDVTWAKTNRFGGILLVIAGIIGIVIGIVLSETMAVIGFLIDIAIVTVAVTIYSYWCSKCNA